MNRYIIIFFLLSVFSRYTYCQVEEQTGNLKHRMEIMQKGKWILDFIPFSSYDINNPECANLKAKIVNEGRDNYSENVDFKIFYIRTKDEPIPIYLQMYYERTVGDPLGRNFFTVPDSITILDVNKLLDAANMVVKNECISFIKKNYQKTQTRLDAKIISDNKLDKTPITRPVNPDFYVYQKTFTDYKFPRKFSASTSVANIYTTVKIFEGGNDNTEQWDITPTSTPGVTGSFDSQSSVYTLTGLNNNYGEVRFKAKDKNGADFPEEKIFTISRTSAAESNYSLQTSSSFILENIGSTSFSPSAITINAKELGSDRNYSGYFKISADNAVLGSKPYESYVVEEQITYTIPIGSKNIKVQLYSDNTFRTLLDEENIPVVNENQKVMIVQNQQQKLPALVSENPLLSAKAIDIDFTGISLSFTSKYYVKDYPFGIQLTSREKILNVLPIQNLSASVGARLLLPLSSIGSGQNYNTINYDTVSNMDVRFLYRFRWDSKKILDNPFFYAESPTLNIGEGGEFNLFFSQIDKRLPSIGIIFFYAPEKFSNPYSKLLFNDHYTAYHTFIHFKFFMSFFKNLDIERHHNLKIDIGVATYNVYETNYTLDKEEIIGGSKSVYSDYNPVFALEYFFQTDKPLLGLSTRIYEERVNINFWLKLFEIADDHDVRFNCLYLSPPLLRNWRPWENDGGTMLMFNYRYGFLK